mmetsp:Transcript_70787/g.224075  ORF Transcript_70787/g.224075 Transcript_70787/m.224075 type:complete len:202 (+) Transcript_70787:340-945(+)
MARRLRSLHMRCTCSLISSSMYEVSARTRARKSITARLSGQLRLPRESRIASMEERMLRGIEALIGRSTSPVRASISECISRSPGCPCTTSDHQGGISSLSPWPRRSTSSGGRSAMAAMSAFFSFCRSTRLASVADIGFPGMGVMGAGYTCSLVRTYLGTLSFLTAVRCKGFSSDMRLYPPADAGRLRGADTERLALPALE